MGEKTPLLKPAAIISALEKSGFHFISQRGSHRKYSNEVRTCIIPMHDEIARGTLRSILLQAGITLEDFLKLL